VHPLLDLHGLTGDEALRRAEGWLRARAADGERTVVIVTGRGSHSSGLPVLRPEIEHLLEGLRGSTVAGWEPTHGSGGFRVRLRPPAPLPGEAVAAAETLVRQYPPELRLRAEESLAELGITPTPALLRAEIRRIAAEDEAERRS
jgi:Smr domain